MPRGNPSPKLAITVDPDVHENILSAAARDGVSVSAWMTMAAREGYYTCLAAQKRGWKTCPSRALPAQLIETEVRKRLEPSSAPIRGLIDKVTYHGGTRPRS